MVLLPSSSHNFLTSDRWNAVFSSDELKLFVAFSGGLQIVDLSPVYSGSFAGDPVEIGRASFSKLPHNTIFADCSKIRPKILR